MASGTADPKDLDPGLDAPETAGDPGRAELPGLGGRRMPYVEYNEVEAICSDCGRIFRSEDALAAHREEAHAGLDRESTVGAHAAPRAPLGEACPVCGRRFDSATTLRRHSARAHGA